MWRDDEPRPLSGPAPKLKAPPGAVDTHIHIFLEGHGGQPGGPPLPPPATVEDYRRVQRRLGLERAVVVQSNAYQLDNACLLESLRRFGGTARGIAAVAPEADEASLERMHALGVRGARIMDLPGGAVGLDRMEAVAARVRPLGWHVIVQLDGRLLPDHEAALRRLEGPYIIDHVGKFLEPVAPDHAAFLCLQRLVGRGNCWVKLSAADETSRTGAPLYDDVGRLAKALAAQAPERLLWASNWPHVGVPRSAYPDDAAQLDLLLDWVPDETTRRQILVDNPAAFYGF